MWTLRLLDQRKHEAVQASAVGSLQFNDVWSSSARFTAAACSPSAPQVMCQGGNCGWSSVRSKGWGSSAAYVVLCWAATWSVIRVMSSIYSGSERVIGTVTVNAPSSVACLYTGAATAQDSSVDSRALYA